MTVGVENILKEWDEVCDAARQWRERIKDNKARLIKRTDRRTRKEICEDLGQKIVKEREIERAGDSGWHKTDPYCQQFVMDERR